MHCGFNYDRAAQAFVSNNMNHSYLIPINGMGMSGSYCMKRMSVSGSTRMQTFEEGREAGGGGADFSGFVVCRGYC